MDRIDPSPRPSRLSPANLLVATLAIAITLMVALTFHARRNQAPLPPDRVTLQGRMADLSLAAPRVLAAKLGREVPLKVAAKGLAAAAGRDWDRGILAVHLADQGEMEQGADLAKGAPAGFRRVWDWAYGQGGMAPTEAELQTARTGLGEGYAASILEARCVARSGGDPEPLVARAQAWVLPRLMGLALAGLGGLFLFLGGLGFLIYLALTRGAPHPLPRYAMSGQAMLLVLLGWFATLLASGTLFSFLLAHLPVLKPVGLPLMYGFHATLGLAYLCLAEGISLRALWARVAPGRNGRALATGLGFFALAFASVVVVALALSPILRNAEPPQRDLLELLSRIKGPLAVGLLFLTVAVAAPVFEELLFRGFMLPWLGERLEARLGRRWGWVLAVGVTGLAFGAMHLQPLGLPTLGTLGIVLGFAFLRTGNLLTAILVHGLWNGAIFILMRLI